MKLYHGSTVDITNIDFSRSKPNKDFGRVSTLVQTESKRCNLLNIRLFNMEESLY